MFNKVDQVEDEDLLPFPQAVFLEMRGRVAGNGTSFASNP
jgi:hypothetical protein